MRGAFSIQRRRVLWPAFHAFALWCIRRNFLLRVIAYIQKQEIDVHVEDMDVLLVEDNPGDIRLAQEAFAASKRPVNIHVVRDGVDAMAFLQKEGAYAHAPRPHLILLDLNLPKMNGREVLVKIKTDASLKSIPTIILTSSELEADLQTSYENNANCYVTKPKDFETFVDFVRAMETLWFVLTSEPESLPNVSAPAESFA